MPDPQEILLQEMEAGKEVDWDGGSGKAFTTADVIGLAVVLQRNVLSIMIYQRSLAALVAEARVGNDNSLFDVVRLDRSIVSCPSIASREIGSGSITAGEIANWKRPTANSIDSSYVSRTAAR